MVLSKLVSWHHFAYVSGSHQSYANARSVIKGKQSDRYSCRLSRSNESPLPNSFRKDRLDLDNLHEH
jgi:hypothetical protein